MANSTLVRAFIRAAVLQAQAISSTPKAVLEAIILGHFTADTTQNGKTIVSTSAAGSSVTFALPSNFGTAEIMELAETALQTIEAMPDPNNPTFPQRRIKRLRVNFGNA